MPHSLAAARLFPRLSFRLALCLAAWFVCNPLAAAQAQADRLIPLVAATETWAPYVYEENGHPAGFDYETARAVLQGMGFELVIHFMPWKRCLLMAAEGQVDAVLDISLTEDRGGFLHFPNEPLSASRTVLFHLREGSFRFQDYKDLNGRVIGTLPGYAYGVNFDAATNCAKETAPHLEANFLKLLKGRVHAVASNYEVGMRLLRQRGLTDRVTAADRPIDTERNYLAFCRQGEGVERADELALRFGQALRRYKQTPEYAAILARYRAEPEPERP